MKSITLFMMLIVLFASCNQAAKTESNNPEAINKIEISISGMSCTGCEETVTKGALSLEGVKEATASFKEGKAWITYEDGLVSPDQISASIEKTGYKVTGVVAVE
jgi:mercuric ion transport protein